MHTSPSPGAPDRHAGPAQDHAAWTVLALMAVAQFMVVLDITVVNVALPSIGSALGFAGPDLQWVVTAYVLFTGGLMLFGGRLADLAGRRRTFLAGLGIFTAASLASGLAWSPESLIVARALQGVGAALLLPSALSIVTTTYAGAQRTKALAVWGAIGSAGAAVGVLLGGVLTQALSWQWIFLINVPVGAVVAPLVVRAVGRAPGAGAAGRPDIAGAATLMGGLLALVLAIEGVSDHGWLSAYTVAHAAGSAVLLGAFARIERRVPGPLVPPAIWGKRSLSAGAAVMLLATGLLVGAFFLGTLMLQHVLGASAIETGLAFLPFALVILVGAHAAAHLLPKVGSRVIVAAGLLLAAGGAGLLSLAPADAGYLADLLPGYLLLGLGVGLTFVAVSVAAMTEVEHADAGLASGVMTTAHELGAAIGVAVLAAVAAGGIKSGTVAGFVDGYGSGFAVASVLALAGAMAAMAFVPSVRPAGGRPVAVH